MAISPGDGSCMIEVYRDVRTKFAGTGRATGTFDEYEDAALSANCLLGTYRVDPVASKLTMRIDRATFPNNDGTTQVRA
jgi:Lipocalin-like domain